MVFVVSEVLAPTGVNILRAAAAIAEGRLVGMPTETVYGLAASAIDASAVARIYAAKRRPSFNPLIAHVPASMGDLDALVEAGLVRADGFDPLAVQAVDMLIRDFWPGPLSIVLPVGPALPDLTCAGLDTVALRSPDHPVAQALLEAVSVPLAAPSANRSGRISPTRAEHVMAELGDHVDCVLDGGTCEVGLESTVVQLSCEGGLT
ncbi:MAG: L-threonylcarbamoyladenylate synthase, partial [Kiritimatiellia bacterium]